MRIAGDRLASDWRPPTYFLLTQWDHISNAEVPEATRRRRDGAHLAGCPLGPETVEDGLDGIPVETAALEELGQPLTEGVLIQGRELLGALEGGAVGVGGLVAIRLERGLDDVADDALLEELGAEGANAPGLVELAVLEPVVGEGAVIC